MQVKIKKLIPAVKINRVLALNVISLAGTTVITSLFGFIYWWLAARYYPADSVGLASAGTSAMMLLGSIASLGLGTLLIGELPKRIGERTPLILFALTVALVSGGILGLLFTILIPWIDQELGLLVIGLLPAVLFIAAVIFTTMASVLDDAFIGMLHSDLQFKRNAIFAVSKLIILFIAALVVGNRSGHVIFLTWMLGILLSFSVLVPFLGRIVHIKRLRRLDRNLILSLGRTALKHHLTNISFQIPYFGLPLIVAVLLSTRMNAFFYMAWMISGFSQIGVTAFTTVLYAIGSKEPEKLDQAVRSTMQFSFIVCLLLCGGLFILAPFVLQFFGPDYAENATTSLRILLIGTFPMIIKDHFISISRIQQQLDRVTRLIFIGSALEVLFAWLGGWLGSLVGVCLGWVLAVMLEAALMIRPVLQAMRRSNPPEALRLDNISVVEDSAGTE